ncbi:hypothetical protein K458DRAFT_108395 [Lentithecium fluviatile CBS 122367]|uniref:Uncharacterized protein n=1 Tax=Lentithecium fluviatile CBS 122367 TaxID=1168545 RepID=A0A6G1IQH1_9PLEO|nr:hypothetical protein K458DRAFT_108395 [Lentithecium fluviatile CBS 122367]
MVTHTRKRPAAATARSSITSTSSRRNRGEPARITPIAPKTRIPFADTSSSGDDNEVVLPPRRKRAHSDPPEDTHDMFHGPKPVFSSFQTKPWNKPKTRLPRRRETDLRLSFVMDELMGGTKKIRPSLANADGHPVPPILPVGSTSSSLSLPSSPETPLIVKSTSVASTRKINAVRATSARTHLASDEGISMSFYKKTPKKKLANIPEHSSFGSQSTRRSFRAPGAFQSFGSVPKPSFRSSRLGNTDTAGGALVNEDVDMLDSQSSPYMPQVAGKKHGYGFSYSDSSDDEEGETVDPNGKVIRTPIINPNTSFRDLVVMRDVARNWSYTQPSVLPCTHAKLEYVPLGKICLLTRCRIWTGFVRRHVYWAADK